MINFNKKKNKACLSARQGFTLIELLVALAIFSVIVISMSSTAFSVIKGQRKAFSLQLTQETSRYILESMAKEIRTSVINSESGNESILNITTPKGDAVIYEFINDKILRNTQDLSPANVKLTGSFYIRKHSLPNRALVTIMMKIESKEANIEERSEIHIQNSITSRSNISN